MNPNLNATESSGNRRWAWGLTIAGFVLMLAGCLDPLEGSIAILAGSIVTVAGAFQFHSRHLRFAVWAAGLVAIGVAALFGLSAVGGVGGTSGRSFYWLLVVLPYPIGAIMELIGSVRVMIEARHHGPPAQLQTMR